MMFNNIDNAYHYVVRTAASRKITHCHVDRESFSRYGGINVNSAAKGLNITKINANRGASNHQIGPPLNSSFH